jgi:hypothetical protein
MILPPSGLVGRQLPRVSSFPDYVSSSGQEAVELAASAGLHLYPWQAHVLDVSLGERPGGAWSAFEVGLMVPRQNGKGSVIEARELAGLFLFGEQLILHTAHEMKTSKEAFRRILSLIENTDDLRKRVSRVRTANGEEAIEMRSGTRLKFVARSTGSGRGLSGNLVILDEAYALSPDAMAALLPTLSAMRNPQLWYTSSAGMGSSEQLRKVRERGRRGGSPSLAYFEWSANPDADLSDREAWAMANPTLGYRISEETIERELEALGEIEFGRERLGIWEDAFSDNVIDLSLWARLGDESARAVDPVAFAVDVSPDRSAASIGMAGITDDGHRLVEVVQSGQGTAWVVPRLMELTAKWKPCAVVIDAGSSAGSLLPAIRERGLNPMIANTRDVGQAFGGFYDATADGVLIHIEQESLTLALAGATTRLLGDSAKTWNKKNPSIDITPLVSVTNALWGLNVKQSELLDVSCSVW